MFRAKIYPKKLIFYTNNIRASVTNCMSGWKIITDICLTAVILLIFTLLPGSKITLLYPDFDNFTKI